eukprot:60547-Pleurochrysis_carterae.AAC.1
MRHASSFYQSTEVERCADADSLTKIIRAILGEMGESLICMLLTFDSLFSFRKVMRTHIDTCIPAQREAHALGFAHSHRCWLEQFERVSLSQHKSYYPHRKRVCCTLQILQLGDLWDYSLSSLESYHAEVGRVADRTG